jgi:hypothetical protein
MPLTDPTFNSPKRKRHDEPSPTKLFPTRLDTKIPSSPLATEEEPRASSPRTNVAYQFKGLQIDGALPMLELGSSTFVASAMETDNTTTKRIKVFGEEMLEIPETPNGIVPGRIAVPNTNNASVSTTPSGFPLSVELDPVVFKSIAAKSSAPKLARAYPSINRLVDSKSRGRKRAGTPPLSFGTITSDVAEEDIIIDPDRAALTWHDDEITGHNPDDPDDDGEGINGIGFKPTPAIAYARAERRRQQMAEYRSRESREARARRSEKRRGDPALSSSSREEAARRVRFLESEANSMITTS